MGNQDGIGTPQRWEAWPSERGMPRDFSYPVVAENRYVLFARSKADQQLAASAPELLRALEGLLQCFEVRNEETFYVSNGGTPHVIPRHLRATVQAAKRTAAKAQGKPRSPDTTQRGVSRKD